MLNEDQLKTLYDRTMERLAGNDWAAALDKIQEQKEKERREQVDDQMEKLFGMR